VALPPHWSDAHARCAVGVQLESPGGRGGLLAWPSLSPGATGGRITRSRPSPAAPPSNLACASASLIARDRPGRTESIGRPGHCGRIPTPSARHPDRRPRACGGTGEIPTSGASLEVFRPLQRLPAAPRSCLPGGQPGGLFPLRRYPRHPRPVGRTVSRSSPLRVCAFLSRTRRGGAPRGGRAGVGVPAGSVRTPELLGASSR
jgi:hypothetical protein